MTDTLIATAAAARYDSLRKQVAAMEQQMERLIIRLQFWREERDRQESIAFFHSRRQQQTDAQESPDARPE